MLPTRAVASMSGGTSQPNLNAIVEALRNTPRDTGLDLETLNECSDYWETVRTYYLPFDSGPKSGNARLYQHEIPGGQYTNLREQAAAMGLGHRWREVEKMYAEVNQLFGDIVKVTPSSKVVGDMTLFLMAKEMTPADMLKLDEKHDLAFPNSVVEMFSGVLGVPPDGWPKKVQKILLARSEAGERAPEREHAGGGFRRGEGVAGKEDRPRDSQRRFAELPAVSGSVSEIRQIPPDAFRRERAADARVFLRVEIGRRNYRRNRSRAKR